MQKISYYSSFAKLAISVMFAAAAYIACFSPAVTHAQTSAFAGAEIVILNQDTPFHYEPGNDAVKFIVARGTLAEVLYFAKPEVRDGQIWRKLRVADGYYGYVRESLISKYTGTIPDIWLEFNYQPTQVHLNYEARKANYNIVIDQGVNYVTRPDGAPVNTGSTGGNTTSTPTPTPTKEFKGGEIVVLSKNATYYDAPNGNRKFVVAKGSLTEILYFYEPQTISGKTWYKLRVADGNWGYVTSDALAKYTGTIPNIWLEFNYQPTQVHLNYEARKANPKIVINAGVNYVTAPNNVEDDEDVVEEEDKDELEEVIETVENNDLNIKLMQQIISLLQQLLKLKLSM